MAEVSHEAIAINICPAVHEDAILRIQPPDEIPSPVVVIHHRSEEILPLEEADRSLGEFLRFGFRLLVDHVPNAEYGEVDKGKKHQKINRQVAAGRCGDWPSE